MKQKKKGKQTPTPLIVVELEGLSERPAAERFANLGLPSGPIMTVPWGHDEERNIVDAYSRMIVGWRVASHMRTSMVLDALEMARWSRGTRCRA
jgi:transposase InsO family protein